MAAAVERRGGGQTRHVVRPFSAPARRRNDKPPPAEREQPRPGSARPQQATSPGAGGDRLAGFARPRPGSAAERASRPASGRTFPPRPSSARTVAAVRTPDQYSGWGADARASLDRRAATPVGRHYYYSNDRLGRWRGLGRAQWAWHRDHGHSALAVLQEHARPWHAHPVARTPIVAMAQSNAQTQLMGVGGPEEELGRSVLVGVEAEEDRSWRNATPSRMLGSVRSPRLLDQLRRSLRSPVILCSWRLVTG